MKNIFLILITISLPFWVSAQKDITTNQMLLSRGLGIANDIVGVTDVVGTPFIEDNWTNAIVKTQKDELFKGLKVKYSVYEDLLFFQGENDMTMKFIVPIKEFSLLPEDKSPQIFRSGFPKIGDYNESSFYQVLTDGKVKLLKKTSKRITDRREYNSAVTTKEYISNTKYFLFQDGKITDLKKDKSFIINYLEKNEQVENFISNKKIDFKRDENLIAVINFYNTL